AEVRMVVVGDPAASPSIELCGGTHVERTGHIGLVLITGEEAAAAGVRRIEAVAGQAALAEVQGMRQVLSAASRSLGAKPQELEARLGKLQADVKAGQREVAQLRDKLAAVQTGG